MTARPAGVYDIPENEYHADKGSLSVSGAKKLLSPSCPARFKWELDNGQPNKPVFDFGRAAHAAVLGVGASLRVVDFPNWQSKAARDKRDEAYAAGETPLLAKELEQVVAMAAAVQAHPIASALLNPDKGKPEQSAYRVDLKTGVELRCRFDWLPETDGGRLLIPDYKTAASAEPWTFARAAAAYGYHMQHAWYADMATALGLAQDVSFVFIVQEKVAPYVVTVLQLDDISVDAGRRKNREAIDLYAQCMATDTWPSYTEGVELISLPAWATDDEMEMVV